MFYNSIVNKNMFNETGQFVSNLNKIQVGHNYNSLDVIMPEKRMDWVHTMIEHIGAQGGRAITVTFTDAYLNKYKEDYLMIKVNEIIKKTKGVIDHILQSEYSQAGRFHLHGVVYCKDLKSLGQVRRKMSLFGICKIKTIDNTVKWADYCTKDMKKKI